MNKSAYAHCTLSGLRELLEHLETSSCKHGLPIKADCYVCRLESEAGRLRAENAELKAQLSEAASRMQLAFDDISAGRTNTARVELYKAMRRIQEVNSHELL
ncbi:hypothetical protein E2R60_20440 [Paenibacillus dendritiformis]|uniref:hypothetical protein n=1 Tax=Paenibacillus dendritiformis TaxID=130049 RepID=UPI001059ECB6|nr:hypothetical protein [Paenibacillus dendritiformis]TDL50920.1 hypothetical protein E2R60_20440 [Paenibacillus dendritiformis]